jgi:glutamate-ammonia-ligase adenylyltransferase
MEYKMNNDLPEILLKDSQSKWDAFLTVVRTSGCHPPEDPLFIEILKRNFAFSDFMTRSLTRNPELLRDFIESGDLERPYAEGEYARKLKSALSDPAPPQNEEELSLILRRLRSREMCRIAWRDLSSWADLEETMVNLSALADACLDQALSVLYDWECRRSGIPYGTDQSRQFLVVFGMGKLGGQELNFSSDIDLIFAYPKTGVTKDGPRSIRNEEFFARLCRSLIKVIGAATPTGIVFRVDMRLRPFGESGPIVMTFDAMEDYYQTQGREWERYALIKARVAAGDKEAGAAILSRLRPFVYRRYLDYGVFESLRDMKKKISIEVQREKLEKNIKLGPGGIREIEFFGQIFQLIRGGVTPVLQEQRIMKVLSVLAQEKHVTQDVCSELLAAYVFLRKTENRIQEFSDQQTHNLPSDAIGKLRLSVSMGFSNWTLFSDQLEQHMEVVHFHFNRLLGSGELTDPEDPERKVINNLDLLWKTQDKDDSSHAFLRSLGFDNPAQVLHLLDNLHNDHATRALSSEGQTRLDKLMPLVLKEVGASEDPDLVLVRIIDLIKAVERRTNYLALLLENPPALVHLVKLANASPWIISFLSRHPVLLDELLDPRTLYSPPERADLKRAVHKIIENAPSHDLEQQIIELCIFKQVNILRVAAADVTGALPLMRVSDYLTEIAEIILGKVLDLAWNSLVAKHGAPLCLLNGEKTCDKGFSIIGFGKLGGIELGYGSDLDLVFMHTGAEGQTRGGAQPIDNSYFFSRLGQKIIHILTASTPAGRLYETDMRLRPNGSSGVLAANIKAFKDYQGTKAWTWEHQALVRARALCGDSNLTKHFEQIRRDILVRPRVCAKLRKEVAGMRERMRKELLKFEPGFFDIKQGRGGIVDIEFMVQYLVLLNAHGHVELTKWTDMVRLLESLADLCIIDLQAHKILKKAYLSYRSAVHKLSLQKKPAKISEKEFNELPDEVTQLWNKIVEGR